jgi:preprotein translocase subunit Sec61beta
MKLKQMKNTSQGPSSAIGIMKFNESLGGYKLSPELVVGLSVAFVVVILIFKLII